MKKVLALLLLMTMVIGIAGCGSGDTGSTEAEGGADVGSGDTTEGRFLRIATDVALPAMDPHVATDGLSFDAITATMEGLYMTAADGSLYPAIAESYELSDDGMTYTFTLRDGVKWNNGEAVTANDFVYSWRRLVDPEVASDYSFMGEVAALKNATAILGGEADKTELGITAQDDKTLIVTLERPVPYFLSLTAFPTFFPLNEAFVTEQGADFAQTPENMLACGPYKMVEWNKGYGFKFVKNDDYYDAANVKVDGLEYRVIKDSQTAALKFDSGEMDVVKLTSELVDNYKENAAYQQIDAAFVWYISPNNNDEIFSNVNARKALQHAINKENIVNNILNDGSTVANFIVPTGLATGPDNKDFRDTSKNDYSVYDVDMAQEAWEEAKNELGISEANIEILFDDSDTVKKMAEFIQAELEENLPGLTVSLKSQPKKNRLDLMRDGDYQVGLTRWGPDYADPLTYLELFLTGATNNYPNFENTQYDELTIASSTSMAGDAEGRWEAMKQAEDILLDQQAGITPLYQAGYSYLINPSVEGIEPHAIGVPFIYKNVVIGE